MKLIAFLVLALLCADAGTAKCEPFRPGQSFDQEQVAEITATALAFMGPRILEPIPVGQLATWGLRGLTTLDPRLSLHATGGALVLVLATPAEQRVLISRPIPSLSDAETWGVSVAAIIHAGWNASEAVRRARTEGVLRAFFNEVFSHFDPYSRYVPPEQAVAEQAASAGIAGIGARIGQWGAGFIIASVQPDGPAKAAGLRTGEHLLSIDGQDVTGRNAEQVAASLEGPENSPVTLIVRARTGRVRSVRLLRSLSGAPTVQAHRDGPMLMVRLTSFSNRTAQELANALTHDLGPASHPPLRGLVIDLRGNRGGVLAQAAAAANTLLARGLIAATTGRDPQANHVFRATGPDLAPGLPAVVLVDGNSASAAEILAAALADHGRAVVVGSSTLGKGLVQTILPLPDGGLLYVTWSRVLAPLGWPIQGLGVLPQVCTSMGRESTERQLASLSAGVQPMARALARERALRPPVSASEALDIRSACPAAIGGGRDIAAARYLIDHPAAYRTALLRPDSRAAQPTAPAPGLVLDEHRPVAP